MWTGARSKVYRTAFDLMSAGVLEANPYASELVNAIAKASFIYVKKRATPRCQREFLLQVKVGWITFRK